LISLPQRACRRGMMGGCNLLGHFAKHYVRRCDFALKAVPLCGGTAPKEPFPKGFEAEVARLCGIAGLVLRIGIRIPRLNGRSYRPDPERSRAMLACACAAGSA